MSEPTDFHKIGPNGEELRIYELRASFAGGPLKDVKVWAVSLEDALDQVKPTGRLFGKIQPPHTKPQKLKP